MNRLRKTISAISLIAAGGVIFSTTANADGYVKDSSGSDTTLYYTGGKIGIGTTTPGQPFQIGASWQFVPGTAGAYSDIKDNASYGVGMHGGSSYLHGAFFEAYGKSTTVSGKNPGDMIFSYGPQSVAAATALARFRITHRSSDNGVKEVLYANHLGYVGIGTTNPQYLLSVNGTIKSKEIIVESTGWSDYVFDQGYTLMPLNDVAAFIEKNGHLPGIPSAQEVGEKGINLADMSANLMKKIEELTLYTIQLKKENDLIRAELDSMKAQ